MTTTLVTGATGLVGRAVVAALLAEGRRVVALARSPVGRPAGRAVDVAGDVRDGALLERVLAEHGVGGVVHLAGPSTVDEASAGAWDATVGGTAEVLEAARRAGAVPVVVASSARVFGPGSGARREDDPLAPGTAYGRAKVAAERLAQGAATPAAVLRMANVHGPGDRRASRLVPGLLADVAAGRPPVLRSDGRDALDLLHAEDAAAAHLALLAHLRAGRGAGEVFHAGGGSALEVREVVAVVLEAAGRADLVPRYAPERPAHERQATWLDSTKLHTATGWAPGVSPVEGLQRTVREAR